MPNAAIYNMNGEQIGEMKLPDSVFATPINDTLMHAAVVMYLANQRRGTVGVKTRGLVRGGGRKPWRQKGTGRARQGSIRAPQWRGGGVVFGPKARDFRQDMPKKARRQALRSALSSKAGEGRVLVIDRLTLEQPKTKVIAELLKKIGVGKALIVTPGVDRATYLSARNIPGVTVYPASDLNVYQVLNHGHLILVQDAVPQIEEVLAR